LLNNDLRNKGFQPLATKVWICESPMKEKYQQQYAEKTTRNLPCCAEDCV